MHIKKIGTHAQKRNRELANTIWKYNTTKACRSEFNMAMGARSHSLHTNLMSESHEVGRDQTPASPAERLGARGAVPRHLLLMPLHHPEHAKYSQPLNV